MNKEIQIRFELNKNRTKKIMIFLNLFHGFILNFKGQESEDILNITKDINI